MRREYPDLFQRALCIIIGSTRYSAFGNMLLLRQPEKHLVMFHRKTNGILTELTPVWEKERKRLTAAYLGERAKPLCQRCAVQTVGGRFV